MVYYNYIIVKLFLTIFFTAYNKSIEELRIHQRNLSQKSLSVSELLDQEDDFPELSTPPQSPMVSSGGSRKLNTSKNTSAKATKRPLKRPRKKLKIEDDDAGSME